MVPYSSQCPHKDQCCLSVPGVVETVAMVTNSGARVWLSSPLGGLFFVNAGVDASCDFFYCSRKGVWIENTPEASFHVWVTSCCLVRDFRDTEMWQERSVRSLVLVFRHLLKWMIISIIFEKSNIIIYGMRSARADEQLYLQSLPCVTHASCRKCLVLHGVVIQPNFCYCCMYSPT